MTTPEKHAVVVRLLEALSTPYAASVLRSVNGTIDVALKKKGPGREHRLPKGSSKSG